jgi:hypothetical protein
MSSKIINVVLVCLFTLCVAGKANAGLIVGDLYEDADESGLYWEYVGSFDLTDVVPGYEYTSSNGIEAALLHFNTLSADEIALSTNMESSYSDIANFLVNHKAFYDTFAGATLGINGILEKAEEGIITDFNGDSLYNFSGDISANIVDRTATRTELEEIYGDAIPEKLLFTNHVFKSVTTSVPEPTTLAIFSLALMGLTARRFKNK